MAPHMVRSALFPDVVRGVYGIVHHSRTGNVLASPDTVQINSIASNTRRRCCRDPFDLAGRD